MLLNQRYFPESPDCLATPTKTAYIYLCLLLAVGLYFPAHGQQAPCSDPAYRQFDFWVGEWDVYHPTADTALGYNHIKNILNGCVIEENWHGSTGWQGKSFNTYNPVDSTWNQVWVDQSGNTYHFKGRYDDNVMKMKGQTTNRNTGQPVLFEMTYTYDPEKQSVRQIWRSSNDEGDNWNTIFDGIYKKKPEDNSR